MNFKDASPERASAVDALEAIGGIVHRMAMKLIVLEMALQETISAMPVDLRIQFSTSFKARAASVMQDYANKLLPIDDSEISLAVARILEASSPAGKSDA